MPASATRPPPADPAAHARVTCKWLCEEITRLTAGLVEKLRTGESPEAGTGWDNTPARVRQLAADLVAAYDRVRFRFPVYARGDGFRFEPAAPGERAVAWVTGPAGSLLITSLSDRGRRVLSCPASTPALGADAAVLAATAGRHGLALELPPEGGA